MRYLYTSFLLLFIAVFSQAQNVDFADEDSANEQERIQNFHSDIAIHENGDITVSENITFNITGKNIQRGIVRSLPYYFRNKEGKKKTIKIELLSVKRNGVEEPYHQDILRGGEFGARELYIGSEEEYISPGIHTYQINYRLSNQIFSYDGFDELYWNVTGNDWAFEIDSASATITLPNTPAINTSCYTGRAGSTDQHCNVSVDSMGVNFYTAGKLAEKEGFTVAVSFSDQIIQKSSWGSIEKFWDTYCQDILAGFFVLLLCSYYFITWFKVGRLGIKPTVVPTFNPPAGLSPAACQFLYKFKMTDSILSTVIISIAVKGALKIECVKKKYSLIKIAEHEHKLKGEERLVYNALFTSYLTKFSLSGTYDPKLRAAIDQISLSLGKKYEVPEFKKRGYSYIVLGALLSLLSLHVYFFSDLYNENVISYILPCVIGVITFIGVVIHNITKDKSSVLLSCLYVILAFFFWSGWFSLAVSTVIKTIYSLFFSDDSGNTLSIAFVLFVLFAYFVYCLIFNLKPQKRLDMDASLEGFKLYLKTAEEHRLDMVMIPEHTLSLFEELLPYAIALGVENKWNKKFKRELDLANYDPNWYSGDRPFRGNSSSFLSSFNSSVNRSSTRPTESSGGGSGGSSRSGSSGGGSSGGGRGGGGGRGW